MPPAPPVIALLDACVLYPAVLRDTLLRAAILGHYRLRWSEAILEELRRSLVRTGRATESRVQHLIEELTTTFPTAAVLGYEDLTNELTNHPGDRHVLAAAIKGSASLIVTDNLKHFPRAILEAHGIEAQRPDRFLSALAELSPGELTRIVVEQAADLTHPPLTPAQVLERLKRHAPTFVSILRQQMREPADEH
ncbi:MAG: PIN domain-containing protein [Dehalococcoidia bacterium]